MIIKTLINLNCTKPVKTILSFSTLSLLLVSTLFVSQASADNRAEKRILKSENPYESHFVNPKTGWEYSDREITRIFQRAQNRRAIREFKNQGRKK